MILDYSYNDKARRLDLSYVDENGAKKLLQFNVNRFKSFYKTPTGKYTNWDGAKCDIKWTEKPCKFDIAYYLREMDQKYRSLISGKVFPKVYTFDIETWIPEDDEFPDPATSKFPITTISIVSPDMNCIVLATHDMTEDEEKWVGEHFDNYLDKTDFFHEIKLKQKPYFKYVKFDTEEEMLRYFLTRIVAKVPILTGWNCIFFDWQYIINRIRNNYPNLSVNMSSCSGRTYQQKFENEYGQSVYLPMPEHTVILDMMNVVKDLDATVLPIKESTNLDYIAYESMGINKIEYDGTLQDLYNANYPRYVYYNAIDSILVQLINYRFKCLDQIYLLSLYSKEKIGRCFSKIALTEALVFQEFYDRGIKIVYEPKEVGTRTKLLGAYVKIPVPGIHEYVCCNDFASLYPSTIRTCNLSFENFVGTFYDIDELNKYINDTRYVIVCGTVYYNVGDRKHPKAGGVFKTCLNEKALAQYRNNPNYFVTVNGHVYKNDQDYTFRRILARLKAERDESKYLGKRLDAEVAWDMEHILKGVTIPHRDYDEQIQKALAKIELVAKSSDDLLKIGVEELQNFHHKLQEEIVYYDGWQYAVKIMMNSMYGGSSHVSFYWFNMALANDVTGESRNLTHLMEQHIPDWFRNNWVGAKELHKKLGIEVDEEQARKALDDAICITEAQDPDAYHGTSWVSICYGDTDSLYITYNQLLKTVKGYENMSIAEKRDLIVDLNRKFLDKHNEEFIANYYNKRYGKSVHAFELETLNLSGCWGDVKKRYAQILLWKDGKIMDVDHLKLKVKGLEVVKRSFPKLSRDMLGELFTFMLMNAGDKYLIQKLNMEVMRLRKQWMEADVEAISGSIKVNNYFKYIKDDTGPVLTFNSIDPKTGEAVKAVPWNARALGTYNQIRNYNKLPGEPIYGGLVRWYVVKSNSTKKNAVVQYFGYQAANLPKWSQEYAPVDRAAMFQQTVLDPINRMLEANNMPLLNGDGSLQISLF